MINLQLPSTVDSTFETTLDQTSNTIDTADESKLDDTAIDTNGEDDTEDIDDGIDTNDNSEYDANTTTTEMTDSLVKAIKSDTLQSVDDNGSTPRTPSITKTYIKGDDKNISRSGRVIKPTKYLHDELEESPIGQPIKRKRPNDSPATVQKRRKSDEGSGENGRK